MRMRNNFVRNTAGNTAIEFAMIAMVVFAFTFVIFEASFMFFQWNAAEKATQLGVRIATVSDPVATELTSFDGKTSGNRFGDPMPPFSATPVVCDGATSTCNNGFTFLAAGLNRVASAMDKAYGGKGVITPDKVIVEYAPVAGLGFVGRPGGPVPAITVRLQNMTYDFILVDGLFGLSPIAMPAFAATLVGEDLNHSVATN